jgi:O-antigen ligase
VEHFWVSGWLPPLVAILVVAGLRSWRAAAGVIAFAAVVGLLNLDTLVQIQFEQTEGTEAYGNMDRWVVWGRSLALLGEHPLLGTGVAGYALYYMTYFPQDARSSHSNYLDILAQTGLVGALCFGIFTVAVFRTAWDVRQRAVGTFERAFAESVLGGWAGVVVAMALGDWLLPFVYNSTIAGFRHSVHSWLLLGVLASLYRYTARAGARREAADPRPGTPATTASQQAVPTIA